MASDSPFSTVAYLESLRVILSVRSDDTAFDMPSVSVILSARDLLSSLTRASANDSESDKSRSTKTTVSVLMSSDNVNPSARAFCTSFATASPNVIPSAMAFSTTLL